MIVIYFTKILASSGNGLKFPKISKQKYDDKIYLYLIIQLEPAFLKQANFIKLM